MIMKDNYDKKILNALINKYEKSKSFIRVNKINQNFRVRISLMYPDYNDHSKFEIFKEINETIDRLKRQKLIVGEAGPGNVYDEISLNIKELKKVYSYLDRTPKSDINNELIGLLLKYRDENEVLNRYCREQIRRIEENRSIQFFNNDIEELEQILLAVKEILLLQSEQFYREFSIKLYNDSKTFQRIQGKVEKLLYDYGELPEKEGILANYNLVSTPTYVFYKGEAEITINRQIIDISVLSGDIGISSKMLDEIVEIQVLGNKIITIENLTSFHIFNQPGFFIIYLGGFHNSVRRQFIRKLNKQNPDKEYFHFGDIDVGGFKILEHLKNKTMVPFKPFRMDVNTLMEYRKYCKKITKGDKINLQKMLVTDTYAEYKNTIQYMLENEVKLEQEAVNIIAESQV